MKLAGLKVVDLSIGLPGPLLSGLMADHGADVVKVEAPGGEAMRTNVSFFATLNRGKRSIVLDLKQPADLDVLFHLIEWADVLVESFRLGTADRLGFGFQAARARNPRLVYCSITGFGQHGPLSQVPAHDIAVQAYAGTMPRGRDGSPVVPGGLSAAVSSALAGLAGVLMAVHSARNTGAGDHIDIAMMDALLHQHVHRLRSETERPESLEAVPALLDSYGTKDGQWIVLGAREPKFAKALFAGIGRPDLIATALAPDAESQDRVRHVLSDVFKARTGDEWVTWGAQHDAAIAPVLSFAEALEHPHVAARGMVLRGPAGEKQLASPLQFRQEPAATGLPTSALDQDAEGILRSIGYALAGFRIARSPESIDP